MNAEVHPVPRLVASGVTKRYTTPSGVVPALVDVSFTAAAGSMVALAGESGSGKSTLLWAVGAIERADAGSVVVDGVDLGRLSAGDRRMWRRHHLGVVLPSPADNLFERHDAIGNLRWCHTVRARRSAPPDDAVLRAELDGVGLADAATRRRAELSGGEQQRLAVACALAGSPALLVVDEPTASLDADAAALVVALLRTAADGGTTVIVASHDQRVIDAADDVVRLHGGRRVD